VGTLSIGAFTVLHTAGAATNTFVGPAAGNFSVTGGTNTGVGTDALLAIAGGTANTCVGEVACAAITSGSANASLGQAALTTNISGSNNLAIGQNSLHVSTGSNGTAVGGGALSGVTTGASNTGVGYQACQNLTTGGSDICLGAGTTAPAVGSANLINLGNLVYYNDNSTAAPAVVGGSSPTIDAHANNRSGRVTVGSGAVGSLALTFAGTGYSTWNHCRVTPETASLVAFGYSYSLTVLTVTATSLTSAVFDYDCDGY
jgi:hypothetical protein